MGPLKENGENMSFRRNIKKKHAAFLFCSADRRLHTLNTLLNSQVKEPAAHHATDEITGELCAGKIRMDYTNIC